MPGGEPRVGLAPDEFAAAFPFHFAFGRDMRVQQVGPSLSRVCPELVEGASVEAGLVPVHPPVPLTFENVQAHGGDLFVLATSRGVTLRGQMLHQVAAGRMVFMGSPWFSPPSDQAKADQERLSLVASKTHSGVILADAQGVIEWVNPGFERLTGFTLAEAVGCTPGALLQGGKTDPATRERMGRWVREGHNFSEEVVNYRKDGTPFWSAVEVTALRDDQGRLQRFIGIASDVTQRRLAQDALARLTTLMTTLIENLQAGVLVEDQAGAIRLANPWFCSLFHLDREPADLCQRTWQDIALPLSSAFCDAEGFLRGVEDTRQQRVVRLAEELELHNGRVVERDAIPLVIGGEWEGFLWVYRDVTWRRREERALRLARQREAEIGSRIQEALLFAPPPRDFPGLAVDVLSRPSETIAGDFHDFFRHGPRCLDILVGDVMGKGIPAALLAAAIKSQFLEAVAHLVLESKGVPPEPAQVVQRVHEVLTPQLMALESFATLVYARFNLHEQTMTLVDCGHERSLRMRGDSERCEALEGVNVPLGFCEKEVYCQVTVPLGPGDRLLFYSDGVTETRNERAEMFGRERLEQIFEENRACAPDLLLGHVWDELRTFSAGAGSHDDVTCIALTIEGGRDMNTGHEACLVLPADLGQLGLVREFVRQLCTCGLASPLAEDAVERLQVAVGEAATNIIRHAYHGRPGHEVEISGGWEADRVVVTLYDRGEPFSPGPISEPDLTVEREGGLGLYLMAQAVDRVSYSREADGRNRVTLELLLPLPP